MDPAFQEAPFASPPEIFGVRLLPFCLGHAATLMAMDSPLFSHAAWTAKELATAVVVCAMPGFAFCPLGAQPGWAEMAVKVGEASAADPDWERTALRPFVDYARTYMRSPRIWAGEGRREAGTPWPWAMVWRLMDRMSERRAWTMPLNRAVCYFMADLEAAGGVEIMTDQDRELAALVSPEDAT